MQRIRKFCPKCGKITEKLYENLCQDCFLEKISIKLPDKILVKKCKSCGKFFVNKKVATSIENSVEIIVSELLELPEVHSARYRIQGNMVHVSLILRTLGLEKTEKKSLYLSVKEILCKTCSMKAMGYYQAVLQVRVPENLQEMVLSEIKNQINYLNQYDNLAFVSKVDKIAGGTDVYIGSKSSAKQVAKYLKNRFKANIKISRKLSGILRGKKLYRDTILISIK